MTGPSRRLAAALVAIVVIGGAPASAGEPGDPRPPAPRDDGRRTLTRFVPNLGRGVIGVFNRDNLVPFVAGGAVTSASALYDQDVAGWVSDPDHGFGKSFEDGASPAVLGVVVGGVFVGGRLARGQRFRSMSYDLAQAFLINWGYTTLVKEVVGRERPNGQDDKSFPSGHASNAFALAAVAERHYGWKVGVPIYALASAVAVSRLQRNKHYLSDVLAGATLGYLVGRTVVRVNGSPIQKRGPSLAVSPIVGRSARGVMVAVRF